jgi:predicted Zn-dependent peptidase
LKTIIKNDCGWGKVEKPKASYVASNAIVKNPGIYFVKVPRSSISHIRIGKTLKKSKKDEQTYLASMQLGGGFTSTLMERLRTQEGLVYGADLRSHYQANYGRTILSTETSSSKTLKVLEAIESTLTSAAKAETPQQLDKVKTFARGQYLLAMDDKNQILKQIVHYEHRGKTVQDLKKFIEKTALVSEKDVLQEYRKHFRWDDQTIVILGTEKTLKKLRKKYKNIRVYQYKKFL